MNDKFISIFHLFHTIIDQDKNAKVYSEQYIFEDNHQEVFPKNFHFHLYPTNYACMKLQIIDKEDNHDVLVYVRMDKPI